uniref:N-acetylmuramoyl-L-alanine amidase-like n=2 Tax=Gouania willdenowi TaxID=441366 RepID=A0A8C5I3M6_GOUWI
YTMIWLGQMFLGFFLFFTLTTRPIGVHSCKMDSFIQAVKQIEDSEPNLSPLALVRSLRRSAGLDDEMTIYFLGASYNLSDAVVLINASSISFFHKAIHHMVTDAGEERGVVLTPDGTTVALAPLLLGIESGLKARAEGTPAVGLFPLTLGRILGLSFFRLQNVQPCHRLGPNGCWDNMEHPKVFRLARAATLATDALINGGMDGVILGSRLSNLSASEQPPALSEILKGYYVFSQHEGRSLNVLRHPVSPKRRELSRASLQPLELHKEVMETLALVWKLEKIKWIAEVTGIGRVVKEGLNVFVHKYWDCPQVISRCQWGAQPFRGTPIPLSLPLPFLYIHHTENPSEPCLTFEKCASDMRAIQRYHQDERGWSDIGYSFVIGSEGHIFEGRGWEIQGRHTKGHNSIGYGVSVIGNYNSTLPSVEAMDLIRHRFYQCAVDGGGLMANFTLHGHRQVVATDCPGDAFFEEIKTWEHFRD